MKANYIWHQSCLNGLGCQALAHTKNLNIRPRLAINSSTTVKEDLLP